MNIKEELLKTNNIEEFKKICIENSIKSSDLDEELLRYYNNLGDPTSAYDHTDPREVFK